MVAKWYVPEVDSPAALALRKRFKPPAVLTPLHRLELTAAWHLKVFRGEITLVMATQAADDLQTDVNAGVWITPAIDHGAVFSLAERLCRRHSPTLGTRPLDVLHVAAAVALRQRHFVTGDGRQRALAGAAGLKVITP